MTEEYFRKISTAKQLSIVQSMLLIAQRAETAKDAETLAALSELATLLQPEVDENEVTFFFDLGEYLHECAQDILDPMSARQNEWRAFAFDSLQKSLAAAEAVVNRTEPV